MKKIQVAAVLILLCSGIVFAQNGVIQEITGTVELLRAGTSAFVPAKVGDTIAQNTIVSTGFKSSALVKMGSATILVRPLTRLSLAELSAAQGTETINVSLQTGRVQVEVNPPSGSRTNMSVRAPTATASVRGTKFKFDTKNVIVQEGTVAFRGKRGGIVLVSAGSSSQVKADEKAADPIETGALTLLPPPPSGSGFIDSQNGGAAGGGTSFGFIIGYPSP